MLGSATLARGSVLWTQRADNSCGREDEISDTMADLAVADGVLYTSDCPRMRLSRLDLGGWPTHRTCFIRTMVGIIWHYSRISGARLLVAWAQLSYAAAHSGDLYAFDTQTRQLLWQRSLRTLQAGAVSRMKLLGEELYVGFNEPGGRSSRQYSCDQHEDGE